MRHAIRLLLVLLAGSSLYSQVSISGTVRSKVGTPLAGVTVQLTNQDISTITDVNGDYQLGDAAILGTDQAAAAVARPVLDGTGLSFTLESKRHIRISVSDPAGHSLRVCDKTFLPGTHRVRADLRNFRTGCLFVAYQVDNEEHYYQYLHFGNGGGGMTGTVARTEGYKSSAVSDTLVFNIWSYQEYRVPVTSYTGTHDGVLDPMGDALAATVTTRTYEHEGVTFEFDAARQVGHYVHGHNGAGDLFVVGATKLKYQDEYTQLASGRYVNGAMLNILVYKSGTPTGSSGFTSTSTDGANYDASMNVMANPDKQVSLVPGDMLVVSQSNLSHTLDGKSSGVTDHFIVVACVAQVPYWDEFRPPFMWPVADKAHRPRFRLTDVDFGKLPSLSSSGLPVPVPDPANLANRYRYPAIDYAANYTRDWLNPVHGLPTYGRDLTEKNEPSLAYLLSDQPLEEKRKILTGYAQHGIDRYGVVKEAVSRGLTVWPCDGGHNNGRLVQIMVSGHLLGHNEMKNILQLGMNFQELVMTVYVTQDLVDVTQAGIAADGWQPSYSDRGYQPYEQGMVDHYPMPEWRGKYDWNKMNYRWSHPYRFVGNMSQHYSDVLAILSLGLRGTLDHDAFIDCKIRHWSMLFGQPDPWRYQGGTTPLYSAVENKDTALKTAWHAWFFRKHVYTYYSFPWE